MKKVNVNRSILRSAHALQASYAAMKAPKTQNVRNPFPMHTLIRCVLPSHTASTAGKFQAVLAMAKPILNTNLISKTLIRQFNKTLAEAKTEAGLTPTEITETLVAKGFLVNPLTVKMTLQTMGDVGSIPQAAAPGKRGRGESLYFLRA
jgi:hypothetical protein